MLELTRMGMVGIRAAYNIYVYVGEKLQMSLEGQRPTGDRLQSWET